MKIHTFTISTKKGDEQTLRFGVAQEVPYPDIEGNGSGLHWRNFGGLFGQYGSKAQGIGEKYYCYLLAPDVEIPDDYNRTHFAGYADYHDKSKVNGGTMTFRGKDLGEMSIHFDANPHWQDIKVRGFERATGSEREAITSLIVPRLQEFIAANKAELRAEAIAKVKKTFSERIKSARASIDALENEAQTATY